MKELKFRVWDRIEKQYYYIIGFCYEGSTGIRIWYEVEDKEDLEIIIYNKSFHIDNIIIEQYIGYQDINNTDIYEGDIFVDDWTDNTYYMYIEWNNENSCYVFSGWNNEYEREWDEIGLYTISNMEIVGNIFEGIKKGKANE